jgi:hypothetical protein
MYVRLVLREPQHPQAMMLLDPVHLVLNSYVIQMNTFKIIIVFHVHPVLQVKEVQPVEKILSAMYFYAETMNTP